MKTAALWTGLCILALPALGAPFPAQVSWDGRVIDAEGVPLDGDHDMVFRYFTPTGEELLSEAQLRVPVVAGSFHVELGTGELSGDAAFDSLADLFARHPEVRLEVTVGDTTYAPRIGILPAGHSLESRLVAAGLRRPNDGQAHWKHYQAAGGATAVQAAILAPLGSDRPETREPIEVGSSRTNPYLIDMEGPVLSVPARELPVVVDEIPVPEADEVNPLRHESMFDENGNLFGTTEPKVEDPLASRASAGGGMPALAVEFEGINNINGVLPPDTEGAVGPNHYVQVVNLSFAIYSKTGSLIAGPFNTNTLWAGFGGPCQTFNNGDAIFMYDQPADRFMFAQFAVSGGNIVCFAVSQTPDPTGSYFLYSVTTPRFPDYFKLGVWPATNKSAYFMGTNSGFQGAYDVFALDRDNMLAGNPARPMQVFQSFPNLVMPADVDGAATPAANEPGLLYSFRAGGEPYFNNPPTDSLDLYEFDVDWTTPANSTFTLAQAITPAGGLADFNWTVCGFFAQNCIPQPGTAQGLDSASWWPMQRLVYRRFPAHETLLGTWTVDVNPAAPNRAAPRWFELRRPLADGAGWSIFQQGTWSPDAIHRWMPSIAMDADGNIAIGYSRGDGANFASIYYSGRLATDPLGTLRDEALMEAGTGSQTHAAARWGDYSSMELDPADDCTFWYTTEYLQVTGNAPWRTRVGAFSFPECGGTLFADGFESGNTSAWDQIAN